MTFRELFEANRLIFYCIYGQIFFVLGVVIAVRIRRDNGVPLTRPLWFLSAFGILHGLYEWSYVVLPVQEAYLTSPKLHLLRLAQRPLEALSFFFLFQSGVELIRLSRPEAWIKVLPATVLVFYMAGYFIGVPSPENFKSYSNLWDLWARYLLCLPGALAAAYGLYSLSQKDIGVKEIAGALRGAACAFFFYAIFAGLMVPPAEFFPASLVNRRLVSVYLGVPPQLVRALAGLLMGYFVIQTLRIYEVEVRRLLDEAIRTRAVAWDRERISRDLHDGILQVLYGTGLVLKNAVGILADDVNAAKRLIQEAVKHLDRCMTDVRKYVFDLQQDRDEVGLDTLTELVTDLGERHHLEIDLTVADIRNEDLHADVTLHLYHFLHEALSNVTKHAGAKKVCVTLTRRADQLDLTVADDGTGFVLPARNVNHLSHQHGLKNMERRAELLGGTVAIKSAEGRGTRITLILPLSGVV